MDNKEYDKDRENYFSDLGIKTLRFWNNEINTNIDGIILKIESELKKEPHPHPLLESEGDIYNLY